MLLLLYEAHARRSAGQNADDLLLFFLFFLGGGGSGGVVWKMQVKVYDTKYVTVCTSRLCRSLTLASDWLRRRSAKIRSL